MLRIISGCSIVALAILSSVSAISLLQADQSAITTPLAKNAGIRVETRLRPAEFGVGRMIRDVAFSDMDGREHRLSEFTKARATVVAVTSTSCPISGRYLPTLAALARDYSEKHVNFLFVNPTRVDSEQDIRAAIDANGLPSLYIRDPEGVLLTALGCRTTTECFVLDQARTLVYRGAVDDQHGIASSLETPRNTFLVNALEAVLAGTAPQVGATASPGSDVHFERGKRPPTENTYHNRISRILQANCVGCHRAGGDGPFALDSYPDVTSHAAMIRRVVEQGIMPPWFAAPSKDGRSTPWSNDCTLGTEDRSDLLAWLRTGRGEGNPADAPLPMTIPPDGWRIGKPDLVIQIPQPVKVKAQGVMAYQYFVVPTRYEEDLWVQAVEIRPTVRDVVHHVLVFMEKVAWNGDGVPDERRGFLATYVPGCCCQVFPDGYAKRVPKGILLRFQIHYTPNGKAVEDQLELGLVLAKKPPMHEIHGLGIANNKLQIPALAENHSHMAAIRAPMDIQLFALMPHMHIRGKAFRYEVIQPDGATQLLLDIPRFDFNWQLPYFYSQPPLIPRGSTIKATGWFNNSPRNPANPDATKIVRWGPQSSDEMLIGYIDYVIPGTVPAGATHEFEFTADKLPNPIAKIKKVAPPGTEAREMERIKALFQSYDKNDNGEISLEEWMESGNRSAGVRVKQDVLEQTFRRLDADRDEKLTIDEIQPLLRR